MGLHLLDLTQRFLASPLRDFSLLYVVRYHLAALCIFFLDYFMGGFYGKLVLWDLRGRWVVVGDVQMWCCV